MAALPPHEEPFPSTEATSSSAPPQEPSPTSPDAHSLQSPSTTATSTLTPNTDETGELLLLDASVGSSPVALTSKVVYAQSKSSPTQRHSDEAFQDFAVGFAEDMNRRFRRTMEDAHRWVYDYNDRKGDGFFGIYDGHAGSQVAEWCGEHLHELLQRQDSSLSMPERLHQAFVQTNKEVVKISGCTAVVSVIMTEPSHKRMLYTANVGDARAVLCRNGKAVRLTYDHKGSDVQEIKRVVDSGGFLMHHRVNGVLAVTRALGDLLMKDLITSQPYTSTTELTASDSFLILACDGVWDVLSDQEAVDLVKDIQDPQEAATLLLKTSLSKNSMDNISCMMIRFCDNRDDLITKSTES